MNDDCKFLIAEIVSVLICAGSLGYALRHEVAVAILGLYAAGLIVGNAWLAWG